MRRIITIRKVTAVAGLLCALLSVGLAQYTEKAETSSAQSGFKRYCLTLDLKDDPKLIEEYKYWHQSNHIWSEIPQGIREVGITDMEIYLLGTRLFMILEAGRDYWSGNVRP